MSALEELDTWFAAVPRPRPIAWASVEAELGCALPSDYRSYSDRFPQGAIQDLNIYSPAARVDEPNAEHPRDFSFGRILVDGFYDIWLPEEADRIGWPDPSDLLPWGDIDGEVLFCWVRRPANSPDEWSTVAFINDPALVAVSQAMTTCVRDLVHGTLRVPFAGGFDKRPVTMTLGANGQTFEASDSIP